VPHAVRTAGLPLMLYPRLREGMLFGS
jgi:hypothetical protein